MTRDDVETVVIGAGQAGLAVSRLLAAIGREHVVLDRGRPGERWRSERWSSLRLLTPNWLTRLPDWSYSGDDPDGFMTAGEVAEYLQRYAVAFRSPVVAGAIVYDVAADSDGCFRIHTTRGDWRARNVVVATGPHARMTGSLPRTDVPVIPSTLYRDPRSLPVGGVLVVGASATGVQIASELAASGREVVLAVGRHTRMPRAYRGLDIYWWMHATGRLAGVAPEGRRGRREPSLQLTGGASKPVDLHALHARGVRLAGRVTAISGRTAHFDGSLRPTAAHADVAMNRFLDRVDEYVASSGLERELETTRRPPSFVPPVGPSELDMRAVGVSSIVLATGLSPDYSWLRIPVVGPDGLIVQRRGATAVPGLYVVGQPMQHRRDSASIDGARHNAHDVVAHIVDGGRAAYAAYGTRVDAYGTHVPADEDLH